MKRIITVLSLSLIFMHITTGCGLFKGSPTVDSRATVSGTALNTGTVDAVKKVDIQLFFPNVDNSAMLSETREITVYDGAIIKQAVLELIKGPVNKNFRKPFPEGTKLLGVNLKADVAIVDLTKDYNSTAGLSEILARASLVNTLTGIYGVKKVKILIEGEELIGLSGMPIGEMTRFSIDNEGYPIPGESKTVTLYFGGMNAINVIGQKRQIMVDNGISIYWVILNELIRGPEASSNVFSFMPPGTRVLSVQNEGELCTVNFSKEFVENANTGTAGESMIIYSIVNTLTEVKGTNKVQFLIEGEKREYFVHAVFDKPFTRNEDIIGK